jgi:cytochrome P450
MFKNLRQHPETLAKLRQELETAKAAGELSPIVTWKEARKLPYLEACVHETGRIHPPFGLNLERVVPAGGLDICGQHMPEGTIVGMNGWVVHRDQAVFGADAEDWRPERWIEADDATRKKMESCLLTVRAFSLLLLPSCNRALILTWPSTVWRRPSNLSRQAHFSPRNLQAGPYHPSSL